MKNAEIRFVRLKEVMHRVGLSKPTIYRMAAAGAFPKPIKLGEHASAWIERDIDDWIADRIAARDEVAA